MAALAELCDYTDSLLQIDTFSDYCPNGLQVEGRDRVRRLVSGVTASQALLEAAPPDAELLGLDRDPIALEKSARRLARYGDRVRLVQGRFSSLGNALDEVGWRSAMAEEDDRSSV